MQTCYGNVKCVLVGVDITWEESVLDQVFKWYECKAMSSEQLFTQLRGLQYVMTQVGTSGDPHYTSLYRPSANLFWKREVRVGWGGHDAGKK